MGQGRVYEWAQLAFGPDRSTGSNSALKLDLRPARHQSGEKCLGVTVGNGVTQDRR
jgi:hypothetical protein